MMQLKYKRVGKFISALLLCGLYLISCSNKDQNDEIESLRNLPQFYPKQIAQIDKIDTLYFSHLGYKTLTNSSNEIIISDRQTGFIALIDIEGKLLKRIPQGRGPGEIIDAYEFNLLRNRLLYINDDGNKKGLVVDDQLNFISEFKPKPYEGASIVNMFPTGNGEFIFEMTTFDFLTDKSKSREKIFVQYDSLKNDFSREIRIKDRPYARTYFEDMLVGATQVPFSDVALTAYNTKDRTIFVYETAKSTVVELNGNFDTLKVIKTQLPTQKLSNQEVDSLRKEADNEQWKTLHPLLPEFKSEAEKMMVFNDEIWLQSNLRGEFQKWFVLNMDGEITKVVHFPKNVLVTHISNHHIGVRLDDTTFALFEAVE